MFLDFAWLVNQKNVDVFGLILANFYITIHLITFILPVGVVINQIDPISVSIDFLFGYPKNIIFGILIKISMLAIYYPPVYTACSICRAFLPLMTFLGILIIKQEINIIRMPLPLYRFSLKSVMLYKELHICFHILFSFFSNFIGSFLAIIGIGLIFCLNGALITWDVIPLNLYFLMVTNVVAQLANLGIIFKGGCVYHTISTKILNKWKTSLNNNGFHKRFKVCSKREYSKVLRSMRVLKIPVGNFGGIDSEIKANYLNFIQCRVMECLVLFKNWIKNGLV